MTSLRVGILGPGVVGAQVGGRLLAAGAEAAVLYGDGSTPTRAATRLGNGARASAAVVADGTDPTAYSDEHLDAVVIAGPDRVQADQARVALAAGCHVVALADSTTSVEALLGLDDFAREVGRAVVVGTGISPGWSTLLAAYGAARFDDLVEVSFAVTGSAGPACIERRADALRTDTQEWRDGEWVECAARSGSELVWFPEPLGDVDCARGDLSDVLVLHRLRPDIAQITVKTGKPGARPLPRGIRRLLVRRQPPDMDIGGVRVAVTGRINGQTETAVYGMVAPVDVASAVLTSGSVRRVVDAQRSGAFTAAELWTPADALRLAIESGLKPLVYEGID